MISGAFPSMGRVEHATAVCDEVGRMTTTTIEQLEEQIERLIRDHIADWRETRRQRWTGHVDQTCGSPLPLTMPGML